MRPFFAALVAAVLVAALTGCHILIEVGAPAPTVTPTNMPTNMPTVAPTSTPTATPTNMPTKAPTRRPATATPVPPAVPAATPPVATLTSPTGGARVDGKTTFSWSGGPLAPGQAWEVKFSRGGSEFLGVAPPTTNNYLVVDLTDMSSGNYRWIVAVVGVSPYRVISIPPATQAGNFEISGVIPVPSG